MTLSAALACWVRDDKTEVAYLLQIELDPAVEAAFLEALARGALTVRPLPRDPRYMGSTHDYAVAQCIAP